MGSNETIKGEIYVLTQAMLWSLFPVITVLTYEFLTPLYAAGLSMLLSACYFGVILTIHRTWKQIFVRSVLPDILIASVLIGVIFYSLVFIALRYTSAGNVAIIGQMEVFFAFLILSVLLRQEPYSSKQVIGAAVMLLGVVIVLLPNATALRAGDAIMLAATIFPSIGNLAMKNARKKVKAECILFLRCLIGGIFLLLLAVLLEPLPAREGIISAFPYLLVSGLLLNGVRLWLWLEAVHRISIPKAISLSSISPVFTLILSYVFLQERSEIQQILGVIPMLAGVYVLTHGSRIKSTPSVHPVV